MRDQSLRAALPRMAAAAATTLAACLIWFNRNTPPHTVSRERRYATDWGDADRGCRAIPLEIGNSDSRVRKLPPVAEIARDETPPARLSSPAIAKPVSLSGQAPGLPAIPASLASAQPAAGLQWLCPIPTRGMERSRTIEVAAREADTHTQRGFELAALGAYFSSRAEFIQALRLVAQALDTENQTTAYGRALAEGLTAVREAQDFLPGASQLEADLDIRGIIAGHRTPVLKGASCRGLTPQMAMQSYFTFAQEQLGMAAGEELAASVACHGLGKLHAAVADRQGEAIRAASPKAMSFYQAALLVNRLNYMASNDLGVLLARANRYEDARMAVEHSLSIQPNSVGWHNLAVVYQRLGRTDLAQKAERLAVTTRQAESARGQRQTAAGQMVQWVDQNRFAQTYSPPPIAPKAQAPAPSAVKPAGFTASEEPTTIQLCQALGPAAPCDIPYVDCSCCNWCRRGGWEMARAMYWQAYAQGEYVGHARTAHVDQYRIRPDDQLDMIFRITRDEQPHPYKFNVGDEIRVESISDPMLNRDLTILPDGTITLRLIGQIKATGKTVVQLRDDLENAYLQYYRVPALSITPLKVNTKLEDLRATIDRRAGIGGQSQLVRVTPEGSIALPAIGSIPAQGLTLPELQQEINERYREQIEGMEITPVLVQRAPRYVYVLGKVRNPGRFELVGPTTAIQAISMAGGWNVGSNLRQVVVFRRADDWRLLATTVNLQAPLYGNKACPPGEIWLSDSDVVIVPKGKILIADELIELVFTRGIYGVFPMVTSPNFNKLSGL